MSETQFLVMTGLIYICPHLPKYLGLTVGLLMLWVAGLRIWL